MYGNITSLAFLLMVIRSVLATDTANSTDSVNQTVSCGNSHEFDSLDVRQVFGKWKPVELYMHLTKEGVKRYSSCPVVTIWESEEFPKSTFGPSTDHEVYHVQHLKAKARQEYRHLRLLWDEAGQTIEYALYFRNDSSGYWQVFGNQNGSLTSSTNYHQFTGTIQVLKAVNDHILLNFCQEPGNGKPGQLYSVLFSREPGQMLPWELDSVHNMLQSRQLSVASRRMVCGNSSATKLLTSIVMTLFVGALAALLGKS